MAQNSLSNFSRELPKDPSCEIISKSATDLAEVVYVKLWRPFYSTERNHFSNFGRGLAKEHLCEII